MSIQYKAETEDFNENIYIQENIYSKYYIYIEELYICKDIPIIPLSK